MIVLTPSFSATSTHLILPGGYFEMSKCRCCNSEGVQGARLTQGLLATQETWHSVALLFTEDASETYHDFMSVELSTTRKYAPFQLFDPSLARQDYCYLKMHLLQFLRPRSFSRFENQNFDNKYGRDEDSRHMRATECL